MNHVVSKFHKMNRKKYHPIWDQIGVDPRDKSERHNNPVPHVPVRAALPNPIAGKLSPSTKGGLITGRESSASGSSRCDPSQSRRGTFFEWLAAKKAQRGSILNDGATRISDDESVARGRPTGASARPPNISGQHVGVESLLPKAGAKRKSSYPGGGVSDGSDNGDSDYNRINNHNNNNNNSNNHHHPRSKSFDYLVRHPTRPMTDEALLRANPATLSRDQYKRRMKLATTSRPSSNSDADHNHLHAQMKLRGLVDKGDPKPTRGTGCTSSSPVPSVDHARQAYSSSKDFPGSIGDFCDYANSFNAASSEIAEKENVPVDKFFAPAPTPPNRGQKSNFFISPTFSSSSRSRSPELCPIFGRSSSRNDVGVFSSVTNGGANLAMDLATKALQSRSRRRLQFPVTDLSRISEERESQLDSSRSSADSRTSSSSSAAATAFPGSDRGEKPRANGVKPGASSPFFRRKSASDSFFVVSSPTTVTAGSLFGPHSALSPVDARSRETGILGSGDGAARLALGTSRPPRNSANSSIPASLDSFAGGRASARARNLDLHKSVLIDQSTIAWETAKDENLLETTVDYHRGKEDRGPARPEETSFGGNVALSFAPSTSKRELTSGSLRQSRGVVESAVVSNRPSREDVVFFTETQENANNQREKSFTPPMENELQFNMFDDDDDFDRDGNDANLKEEDTRNVAGNGVETFLAEKVVGASAKLDSSLLDERYVTSFDEGETEGDATRANDGAPKETSESSVGVTIGDFESTAVEVAADDTRGSNRDENECEMKKTSSSRNDANALISSGSKESSFQSELDVDKRYSYRFLLDFYVKWRNFVPAVDIDLSFVDDLEDFDANLRKDFAEKEASTITDSNALSDVNPPDWFLESGPQLKPF